jgi:hypothetical protein
LGYFIDPITPYGLSIALQTGLGPATRSSAFGFDTLTIKGRWNLGTNSLGKKTSLLFGAANWQPILPLDVYPSDYLTEDEKVAQASSQIAFVAGLAVTLGNRFPTDKEWKSPRVKELAMKYITERVFQLNNEGKLEVLKPDRKMELDSQIKKAVWDDIYLPAIRSPILQLGVLFRSDNFSLGFEETKIHAVDLYSTTAMGHSWFDSAISFHYFHAISDEDNDKSNDPMARWGMLGTTGAFVDLDDFPPVRTMGLTLGLGYYNYAERSLIYDNGNTKLKPNTVELDVMLSFAGFRENSSAFGIRYKRLWNKNTDVEEKFSLLFSTDLLSYLKRNINIGE